MLYNNAGSNQELLNAHRLVCDVFTIPQYLEFKTRYRADPRSLSVLDVANEAREHEIGADSLYNALAVVLASGAEFPGHLVV